MADRALLFVYGTLRRPVGGPPGDTHYHHRISDSIISATAALLPGAQLYDCGRYPGIEAAGSPDRAVVGDLFEIVGDALEITDQIEGHPDFYARELESVLVGGEQRSAWVYWAPSGVIAVARPIASNDWFDRARRPHDRSIDEQLRHDRAELTRNESHE